MTQGSRSGRAWRWLFAAVLALACLPVFAQSAASQIAEHSKTGYPLTGMHTSARCEDCHQQGVFRGTPRDCASCHVRGARLAGSNVVMAPQHLPTQATCETCHNTVTFSGARFNHMGVTRDRCATCHNGVVATGKPMTPVHAGVTTNCGDCHRSSVNWMSARPDHRLFTVATNCTTCHNGSTATGKTATHIQTTANCIACHTVVTWKPSTWNHSQQPVTNQCSTCHNGSTASGKTANHIPYQVLSGVAVGNCDACHRAGYANWSPGYFHRYVTVSNQCSTCHLTGTYGLTSKPNTPTHAGVTGNCENCHRSTASWQSTSKPDHSLFTAATNCTTCHNGSTATGKTATHMQTTANCIACHTVVTWKPSTWNHTQQPVVNQCSTCHNGTTASGKTANHIPYQVLSGVAIGNCDACHRAGYTNWAPGYFHRYVTVSNQCSTCHLTASYGLTAKPNTTTHAGITSNCESCHRSTASWLTVTYVHLPQNAVGTGTCDNCHLGQVAAVTKPASHIPVVGGIAKCDSCHLSQVSFATSVTMNHSVVSTALCSSCHNGAYTSQGKQGALAKPANHIPEAQLLNGSTMDCKTCHTSTASWTTERMDHNGSMGNGAGWCKACHQTGTSYLGNMQRMALNHNGGSGVKTDCSQSGCHRPLGNTGSTYIRWN
jgi:predicted CXXCH cytochrome family protein